MWIRALGGFWCVIASGFVAAQTAPPAAVEPRLPVIDQSACPFEGCTFRKWIVTRDTTLYSSWMEGRRPVATVKKGDVVTGLTGVHITLRPDRIEVTKAIPALGVSPGDIILRYMHRGEGFADLWTRGEWHRAYDGTFISEANGFGCMHDCSAKVLSPGNRAWWVQVRAAGVTGWTKAEDRFNCVDALSGDPACDKL